MATADELLKQIAEIDEAYLTVNTSTRQIVIPGSITVLGVESDDDVHRLKFKVPRMYGEFDLSEFDVRVNYENARGEGDFYPVDDLTVNGEHITFSWLVDRTAFRYSGDVTFSICMKKYDTNGNVIKEFNTTTKTLPVLEGLETDQQLVVTNPNAFDRVLFRLSAVEAASGLGQDGYYNVVKMTETDVGIVFTIVDKNGETTAIARHGEDARTPVFGVDYWTPEQELDMKAQTTEYARTYIDTWAPQSVPVTLLSGNWTDNKQTVTVDEVGENSIVIVSPEPTAANHEAYSDSGIRCVAQADKALTFQCESVPSIDTNVNIAVYYNRLTDNVGGFTVIDDDDGNVTIM